MEFGFDACAEGESLWERRRRCCRVDVSDEESVKVLQEKFQTNAIKDRMLNHIHQSRTIFFSDISNNCAEHGTGIRSEIVLRIIPQESLQIGGGIDGFVEDCNAMLKPG